MVTASLPLAANAGQCFVEKFLRLGPASFGWVQHEARKLQPFGRRDLAGQCNGLAGRLDAGALASGVALDHDRKIGRAHV